MMPQNQSSWPPAKPRTPLAVLVSGGLDSAILLAEAVEAYPVVYPIFVRVGSVWESAERDHLDRFLAAIACESLQPLKVMDEPVADLYGAHWSLTGNGVPPLGAPDEDSFLPGRNVLLFAKPLLWCLLNEIPELATAPLGSNPFPDATSEFYDRLAHVVSSSVIGKVSILRPYAEMKLHKEDVLQRGKRYPLQHTLSCAKPTGGHHCGRCSKCGERMNGFRAAGIDDPTHYAFLSNR